MAKDLGFIAYRQSNSEYTLAAIGYACDNEDVKILLSMTGIDMFSAMLIAVEIVDVKRFSSPWKLVSDAGITPSTRESSGKTKTGRITKQGSPLLRWILVQCAMTAVIRQASWNILSKTQKKKRQC